MTPLEQEIRKLLPTERLVISRTDRIILLEMQSLDDADKITSLDRSFSLDDCDATLLPYFANHVYRLISDFRKA